MNRLKKMLAVLLLVCILIPVAGCHKKDETAVTVGEVKFTSAYYMCALINADSEAKSKVQEQLTDEEKQKEVDYYSKKIDKKEYVKWVEDKALENLKTIAAYLTLCKKADLKLDDETAQSAESYATYYWSNYGYAAYFEPNGVGQETYKKYMKDSYYSSLYFEHLYGKDGEKEIDAETVKTAVYDRFVLANQLTADFSQKSEEEIAALKTRFGGFVTDLQNGTKTFEQVYTEFNGPSENNDTQEGESEEAKPLDPHASVLGEKDTAYASDDYETVKAMAEGEVKLIERENNAGLLLVVKKDIKADPYYIDSLDLPARHLLKDEEFEADVKKAADDLKCTVNRYAVKQFKVKKIKEPQAQG